MLTANATNGTKSTDGKTFVCNQYNGQNSETNQEIKKIDKKRDKIIDMLQPSSHTGKKFFEQRFVIFSLINSSRLQEWLTWVQIMKDISYIKCFLQNGAKGPRMHTCFWLNSTRSRPGDNKKYSTEKRTGYRVNSVRTAS